MSGYDIEVTRKRVRNVNLRVRRDGSVAVSVPSRLSHAEAERIVRERQTWIERQRKRVCAANPPRRTLLDGETLMLLGTPLTVRVMGDATPRTQRCHRVGDTLEIHVEAARLGADAASTERRAHLLDAFLAEELTRELETLLPSCEARVGRSASTIRLRRMVSRWGSCNVETARVTLNIELAERPRECLEAVLCHELCHLHERGHNQRFYAHLDQAFPTWRHARAILRDAPPRR